MQTDKNTSRGGSGKAANAARAAAQSGGVGSGQSAARSAADAAEQATDRFQESNRFQDSNRRERIVAYEEQLEVEAGQKRVPLGQASVSVRVTEHPERFRVERSHDEAIVSRVNIGDVEPGERHEFVERSIQVPLEGQDSNVVVHKKAVPYEAVELGSRSVTETQEYETRLRREELVENVPQVANGGIQVSEVEEGFRERGRRDAAMGETREGLFARAADAVRGDADDVRARADDIGEGKGKGSWF
ncbi:DUF2382 domain-containing protein [Streptomyces sp. A7024]|uniref:DUF2382 domain-containing protein n=1 Tax=Streptomyces coryli TaxID=1128680 RepID=A0A6G4TU07_9ACTN|nr:DUF2382 domain-containing protein [Streptomyces coryli]